MARARLLEVSTRLFQNVVPESVDGKAPTMEVITSVVAGADRADAVGAAEETDATTVITGTTATTGAGVTGSLAKSRATG